jgi:hypothetical protein
VLVSLYLPPLVTWCWWWQRRGGAQDPTAYQAQPDISVGRQP